MRLIVVKDCIRLGVLLVFGLVSSCGGGGGGGDGDGGKPAPTFPGYSGAYPTPTADAAALRGGPLSRDSARWTPDYNASVFLATQDSLLLGSFVLSNPIEYIASITQLKADANIDPLVNFQVTPDIRCNLPGSLVAGGQAGSSLLILDGKLFDIYAEVANWSVLHGDGAITDPFDQAVTRIVSYHDSAPCQQLAPILYPDRFLSFSQLQRSIALFRQLAGNVIFHEYGHYWQGAMYQQLLQKITGTDVYSNYLFPSRFEDEADVIAGILGKKTGALVINLQVAHDLMTYKGMRHIYPQLAYRDFILSADALVSSVDRSHSTPSQRKTLLKTGYDAY